MNLSYRELEARDFEVCRGLLSDQGIYSEETLAALPDIWRQWRADGVLSAAVMELQEGSFGPQVIQFGMSVFVTDEFMASARMALEPHVGRHLVSRVLPGQSPCLDWAMIRRANSGAGLNLLVLHFGFVRRPWTAEQFLLIVSRMPESFYWLHSGYNLKEILIEFSEEALVQFSLASGFVLRSDFQEFYRRQPLPLPPNHPRAHLMGFTREEAAAGPGVNIARLFPYNVPRFFFNRGEQQILLRALQGRSDEETAALLDVTLSTVKKRWASIYDRVSDCAPEMLPDACPGSPQRMRGQEKRRYLLAYLRQHPEELRPSLPQMKSGWTARKQTEVADRP